MRAGGARRAPFRSVLWFGGLGPPFAAIDHELKSLGFGLGFGVLDLFLELLSTLLEGCAGFFEPLGRGFGGFVGRFGRFLLDLGGGVLDLFDCGIRRAGAGLGVGFAARQEGEGEERGGQENVALECARVLVPG